MAGITLTITDLIVRRGSFTLAAKSIECPRFKITVLIGPNGSGKTTLLRAAIGAERNIQGQIALDGVEISRLPIEKRSIGYVPPKPTLFSNTTVLFNLTWAARLRHLNKSYVEEVAHLLNIEHLLEKRVEHLSSGQAQKIAIARALVGRPKAMLLDEPSAFLDHDNKMILYQTLDLLKRQNIPILLATNDLIDALHLSDRLYRIEGGEVKLYSDDRLDRFSGQLGLREALSSLLTKQPPLS